jgi:23S rRNA (guanosine2251-2'-O)-methyltransferase
LSLNSNIIIGRKPVLEAIKSETEIERIYITRGTKGGIIIDIFREAKKRNIKVNEVPQQKIQQFGKFENTQGVVALRSSFDYCSLDDILSVIRTKTITKSDYKPLILILEHIQDTHNLGAILRTAEAVGVDGVIVTKHNSAPVNATVEKTSVGAISYIKIHQASNLINTVKILKEEGFWIFGSSLEKSKSVYDLDFGIPTALIMGNEEKGIRKLTAENCDFLVNIPMTGKIQSLNVSVAAGILLFEMYRQRKN